MPALLDITRPLLHQLFVNQLVCGRDYDLVFRPILPFRNDIERRAERFCNLKIAEHVSPGVPERGLLLIIYVPEVFVIPENGRPSRQVIGRRHSLRIIFLSQLTHLARDLRILQTAGAWSDTIRADDAVVIEFAAVERLAVTIVASEGEAASESVP